VTARVPASAAAAQRQESAMAVKGLISYMKFKFHSGTVCCTHVPVVELLNSVLLHAGSIPVSWKFCKIVLMTGIAGLRTTWVRVRADPWSSHGT
jgi:hypothetical protein